MYEVNYMKPKKKGFSNQRATFLKIDDAIFWENILKDQGCKDIKILVKQYYSPLNCFIIVRHPQMDCYLTEQQIEELVNFDHVSEDLEDLIEDQQDFNMNDYLNSKIDY